MFALSAGDEKMLSRLFSILLLPFFIVMAGWSAVVSRRRSNCLNCGFRASAKEFLTWEASDRKGNRGKLPSGHIVMACPKCDTEMAWNSITGKFVEIINPGLSIPRSEKSPLQNSRESASGYRNIALWMFWIGCAGAAIVYWNQLSKLPAIDLLIIAGFLISFALGMYRGLIRETISTVSWVAALWLAFGYGPTAGAWIDPVIQNQQLAAFLGTVIVFVGAVVLLAVLGGYLVRGLEAIGMSGGIFFGGLLGAAKMIVITVVVLLVLESTNTTNEDWYSVSVLVPFFDPVIDSILVWSLTIMES